MENDQIAKLTRFKSERKLEHRRQVKKIITNWSGKDFGEHFREEKQIHISYRNLKRLFEIENHSRYMVAEVVTRSCITYGRPVRNIKNNKRMSQYDYFLVDLRQHRVYRLQRINFDTGLYTPPEIETADISVDDGDNAVDVTFVTIHHAREERTECEI